jgi:hypothetical protein
MRFAGRLLVLLFLVALGAGCENKGGSGSGGVPPLPASNAGKSGRSNAPLPPPSWKANGE